MCEYNISSIKLIFSVKNKKSHLATTQIQPTIWFLADFKHEEDTIFILEFSAILRITNTSTQTRFVKKSTYVRNDLLKNNHY